MQIQIEEMHIKDFDEIYALWQSTEQIHLTEIDAVLCSHDGRRGYLDHLAVKESQRLHGIGKALVLRCLYNLMRVGIRRWNLYVFEGNQDAIEFWKKIGWSPKLNMVMMSQPISPA